MEMYRTRCISFQQDGHTFYLFKIPAKDLIRIALIERYNSDEGTGYQRPPYKTHYRKIAVYLKDKFPATLPTAILAAISPVQLEPLPDTDEILICDKIRIVDGQHRILGLEELRRGYNDAGTLRYEQLLQSYEFPVILMSEQPMEGLEYSQMEVEAFININSKGKKVKTDLAESLKADTYQRSVRDQASELFLNHETEQSCTTNVIQALAKDQKSFWYNKIILGDEIDRKKPISITAFSKAVRPIVQLRLQNLQEDGRIMTSDLESEEEMIGVCIERAWGIVRRKWPACFRQNGAEYDESYNICKGIGIFPIYDLLYSCIAEQGGDLEQGLAVFRSIINKSQVTASDWLVGGSFTGMSSGQASKKIVRYLKNELNVEQI